MSTYPRLDGAGLEYYTQQLKTEIEGMLPEQKNVFTTCSTARNNVNKVAALSGFKLETGAIVRIRFTDTTTTAPTTGNMTLNVNNTGAKTIVDGKGNKTVLTYGYHGWFVNNLVHEFLYDGTYWVWMTRDNNTTYTQQSLGQGYGTCNTARATAAKVVTLSGYNLILGGIVSIKFKNSVNANATLNINNKGSKPIFYRGKAIINDIIRAGDTPTFIYDGSRYHLISNDNPWKAQVNIIGDPNAIVTITNSAYGVTDTITLDSQGKGNYVCKTPGNYIFSVEDE